MKNKIQFVSRTLLGRARSKWTNLPSGIYCFTYHRIGDAKQCDFDANVYSCTAKRFEQHLMFYKKHFEVINQQQLQQLLESDKPLEKKYALISFDDGYIDNYKLAFPILRKHDLTALFFITTGYVSQHRIPWWDKIAWLIKKSECKKLYYPTDAKPVNLSRRNKNKVINDVLKRVKADNQTSMADKIDLLSELLGTQLNESMNDIQLFMNFEQVKEMHQAGMDIGAHTVNHCILSHEDSATQQIELAQSKAELETLLGTCVPLLAYPVGAFNCYNDDTIKLAQELGYQVAFTYEEGINLSPASNRFELLRFPIENNKSITRLKYALSYPKNVH
ncbi:hypothetical protein PULV_b0548 [Pseudoalteromonas ulvae UL12]|uniref:polysaccharide deacetylase family protein n=1 Tax=Pseudoalteromonas ulvae TaxID=107327 RepID=UPI00186BB174|nr:polysaccharide deacetylase family protein [Pseudoalteromonas ulvae]MBE0365861.1 hypothetical protein [Pseudoalteromonas ulvae UL12]